MLKDIFREFINSRRVSKNIKNTESANADSFPSQELWQQFLDFIRSNRITEKQLDEIISALGGNEDASLVKQVKQQLENTCDYAYEIRKSHPQITAIELETCCYIIEGKSSLEISQLMGVGISTVTSNRCRLREKLQVPRGRSLKVYLDSITRLKLYQQRKKSGASLK